MSTVRTRFAPSPTGFLHVGGVRTALFAWLLARQSGGQFILRIEDTDKAREVAGAEKHIQDSLRWIGIDWDEGVDVNGPFAPYRQSERLDIYREWAQKLIDDGRAYADPYTPEELQGLREQAKSEKRPFLFREHRPESAQSAGQQKQTAKWDGTQPLRFKSEPKAYKWKDAVMGEMSTGPEAIDDYILIKSDGYPTYNFAHIVDDALMKITHVFRSQEFVSSIPKYLNIYEALDAEPPVMDTLPYVMAIDGKKKLSKRDGAKDILDYAAEGYLPEAMMNFLATLGWNDGTEQEVFTRNELVSKFSLDRVQSSPARFDEQRLIWLNGYWIRQLTIEELSEKVKDFWPETARDAQEAYKRDVLRLVHERLKYFAELPDLTEFFFAEPAVDMDALCSANKQLKKLEPTERGSMLDETLATLESSDFSEEDLDKKLRALVDQLGTKPGTLFSLIRAAITGSSTKALDSSIRVRSGTPRRVVRMLPVAYSEALVMPASASSAT
jgi:glutamyl-tRNA synthetase